ncbi:hypothetical protein BRADI_1g56746v3 [Brachypodium distachyon]|uniref:Uncharacterized protein n=1 Tax=Brachypodium distachyon TaxID=15368 RepID=A0A0Q3NTJ5_BRADI|nr:hypothetical protein BRADI_1g56746v3 [Brachypodium distachyon]
MMFMVTTPGPSGTTYPFSPSGPSSPCVVPTSAPSGIHCNQHEDCHLFLSVIHSRKRWVQDSLGMGMSCGDLSSTVSNQSIEACCKLRLRSVM